MNSTILLLRRGPETITPEEKELLEGVYGKDPILVRTDPADYQEHLRDCERLKPAAVLLPMEKPIPSAAMDAGFAHVAIIPGKQGKRLGRLKPLIPDFDLDLKA